MEEERKEALQEVEEERKETLQEKEEEIKETLKEVDEEDERKETLQEVDEEEERKETVKLHLPVCDVIRELGEDDVSLVSVHVGVHENFPNSHGATTVLQCLLHRLTRPGQ